MRNKTTIKTAIPTTSGFRNFALCTLTFAFSTRPPHKPPILPNLPTIYCLFMQNKPNFQDDRINLKFCKKMTYEYKCNWTLGENKPKQSQFQTQKSAPATLRSRCVEKEIFKKLLICTCFYSIIVLFYTICTEGHICRSNMEKAYNAN